MEHLHCDCLKLDLSIIQWVSSSSNRFPELVSPYIYFFRFNGVPKQLAYYDKYSPYLLSNFTKLYVWYWLVELLQYNPIGALLIYYWRHLLRNALESSFMMLGTRFTQSFTYSVSILWLQLSTLTCQYFHHIGFFPCRHPCMVSLVLPYLGISL